MLGKPIQTERLGNFIISRKCFISVWQGLLSQPNESRKTMWKALILQTFEWFIAQNKFGELENSSLNPV